MKVVKDVPVMTRTNYFLVLVIFLITCLYFDQESVEDQINFFIAKPIHNYSTLKKDLRPIMHGVTDRYGVTFVDSDNSSQFCRLG